MCGQSSLNSPYNSSNQSTELGSTTNVVDVTTGNFSSTTFNTANTTYYFAPSSFTATGQIQMGVNDWYVGEYASGTETSLNGGTSIQYGFVSLVGASVNTTTPDTIEYFTVTGFTTYSVGFGYNTGSPYPTGAPGGLTLEHSTVENDYPGSGVIAGSSDVVEDNCLTHNGDYGGQTFCSNGTSWATNNAGCSDNSTLTTGPQNVTWENNEVSFNDQCNYEAVPTAYFPISAPGACGGVGNQGCGCAGGLHFWNTEGSYVEGNYVHDNYDVATWWDTDNDGETITGNYYSGNFAEATDIEIGYNALIEDNNYTDNGWGFGECAAAAGNPCYASGNLAVAIYLSESGGYSSVSNPQNYTTITVEGNGFINNWDGISAYQDGDRFCGSPGNTSTDFCTLGVNTTYTPWWNQTGGAPSTTYFDNESDTSGGCGQVNLTSAAPSGSPDYFDNCVWKAQNVAVTGNTFSFNASDVGGCPSTWPSCGSTSTGLTCSSSGVDQCAANGLFGNCASNTPTWNPYLALTSTGPCGSTGNAMIDMVTNCRSGATFSGCTSSNNYYTDNTYTHTGAVSWQFMFPTLGTIISSSTWTGDGQDSGSTFS